MIYFVIGARIGADCFTVLYFFRQSPCFRVGTIIQVLLSYFLYSIPEGREILELREWRRSRPLGMDFPMVNPAFKFSLIPFLLALGIEVSLLG